MIDLAIKLYPINRSITGEGLRKSLDLINKITPIRKKFLNLVKKFLIGSFLKSGILMMHIS